MRQCTQCNYYSPDDALRCANCGASFIVEQMAATTTQASGRPPEVPRKRRYTRLIPGIGPFSLLRRDPQTGQWGCGPGCLVSTILAAILALGGLLLLNLPHPPPPPTPQANLSVGGNVVPGGSMQIHGSNFPMSSKVEITVDDSPVASRSTIVSAYVGGSV